MVGQVYPTIGKHLKYHMQFDYKEGKPLGSQAQWPVHIPTKLDGQKLIN